MHLVCPAATLRKGGLTPQTNLEVRVFALVHTGGDEHGPALDALAVQLECLQGRRLLSELHVAVATEVAAVTEDGAHLDHIPAALEERPERGGWVPQPVGQVADEDGDAVLAAVVRHLGHVPPPGAHPHLLRLRGGLGSRGDNAPRKISVRARLRFPGRENAILHPPALAGLLCRLSGERTIR